MRAVRSWRESRYNYFISPPQTLQRRADCYLASLTATTLAARIRESVRQGDTVGRTGGDEILVVLPGVHNIDEVARIGEQIRRRAAEPIHESGTTIQAILSIGATTAVPGESVSSITARADAAMYQAKSRDRNTVIQVQPDRRPRRTVR